MVNKWVIVSASVLLASGTAVAGPAAWCKGVEGGKSADMSSLSSKDSRDVIKAFVAVECNPTAEVEAHRADIEQARAAWSKRLGMSEADWADAAAWSKVNDYDVHGDMSTKNFVEMTPVDQFEAITHAGGDIQGPMDAVYVADIVDAKLSEPGRLALLEYCMKEDNEILWAACQQDFEKFDAAKLYDQLRADTVHGGEIRQKIRMLAYELPAKLKEHADKVAKLKSDDVGWKKAFEVAATARGEWGAIATKNAKYLALAADLESALVAQSRSMFEGCDDKTYGALSEAITQVPAKSFEKMRDVRDDPFKGFAYKALPIAMKNTAANLAAISVVICNKRPGLSKILAGALTSTPSQRGPRNYAISRMADSNIQLDKMNARITWPGMRHPYASGAYLSSAGAVIKSIKKDGDHLKVESAPLMVTTEDCVQEHKSNKIERVHDDGRVDYELICDKTAKRQHNDAWGDFGISAAYEKVLKPGMMFSCTYGEKSSDVIAIWANGNATAPMWLLGGKLK
jgi:hypothetical protein